MNIKLKEIAERLIALSPQEARELATILEEEHGIKQPEVLIGEVPSEEKPEAPTEKTSFDLILQHAGPKKLQVIKEVRDITGLGLKESKFKVDSAPVTLFESISKEDAEEKKTRLETAGAIIAIK